MMNSQIRTAYLVKFDDGTYLAPRQRLWKNRRLSFLNARIFSTQKAASMSAILLPNAKVVEVYLSEYVNTSKQLELV